VLKNQQSNYVLNRQNYAIARYPKNIKNTATFTSLSNWFNWELREGCLSKQYFNGLRFMILSNVQIIVCIVSVLLFIYLASAKGMKKYYMLFVFCIAGFLIFLVTACFLNAEKNNLSWQLIWLLMLPLFVSVAGYGTKNTKQLI
jgi:hypothetical protein